MTLAYEDGVVLDVAVAHDAAELKVDVGGERGEVREVGRALLQNLEVVARALRWLLGACRVVPRIL